MVKGYAVVFGRAQILLLSMDLSTSSAMQLEMKLVVRYVKQHQVQSLLLVSLSDQTQQQHFSIPVYHLCPSLKVG